MKMSRLPDKVLKYTSHLRWLISTKSVWSCPVMFFFIILVSECPLASSRHNTHAKPPGIWQAEWKKKRRFSLMGIAIVTSNFSCAGTVLFPCMRCPYFLGISAFLNLFYYIYSIFLFPYPLQYYLTDNWGVLVRSKPLHDWSLNLLTTMMQTST